MANQKHIARLRKGSAAWNSWRERQGDTLIDLNRADLPQVSLIDADLSHADLHRADLSSANLSHASLSSANLSSAHLDSADLSHANLSHAYLGNADLSRANLSHADLNDADLSGANLSGADLRAANLSRADLSGADLSGADLGGATMARTILGECDLRHVRGLETTRHAGPSHLSINTIYKSGGELPEIFVRGTGAPDTFIEYMRALTAKPIDYYTCFLSYSSRDEVFARRLHNDLQQEGVRCWFAPVDMDIGDKIRERIEESIRLYDKLLLILSAHAITSTWVAYEVERALNKEPQGIPNVLFPVRLDESVLTCSTPWARDIKSTRHIGNFEAWTDPQKYQESFQRLLRALNARQQQGRN
jgi:TIR domain/Pentapeptide repeats (8 copies)